MVIKILATGGTVDKEYNQLNGELIFNKSYIARMLKQAKCKLDVRIEVIMLKDSLDMDNSDREQILQKCKECKEDRIIITHGTDTMPETADLIGENIKNKTIILLGAMVPYSFAGSDALFNLGSALTAVQSLQKGVYITMNGKIFSWDNVKKNRKAGEFETIK